MISNETVIEVPFYDVDVMAIVWHGHYVKYMELARSQLLDLIDYDYPQMKTSGYAWPVVDMRIKYVKPLHYKQRIVIKTELVEFEYGMKINFTFCDQESGQVLTKAYSKQVAVDISSGEMCLLSPDILLNKIKNHEKK